MGSAEAIITQRLQLHHSSPVGTRSHEVPPPNISFSELPLSRNFIQCQLCFYNSGFSSTTAPICSMHIVWLLPRQVYCVVEMQKWASHPTFPVFPYPATLYVCREYQVVCLFFVFFSRKGKWFSCHGMTAKFFLCHDHLSFLEA